MGNFYTIITVAMKCPYIFRAGDEAVKKEKRQVGEKCEVRFGKKEYGGYCYPHAKIMGMLSGEKLEQTRLAREEARQAKKQRRAEADTKAQETMSGPEINLNPRVLEAMGYTNPCYLAEEYALFKTLNQKPTHVNYDEKMAYARWLESPKHLREPRTMAEAAKILGVTEKTLISWSTSPDVIDFMNADIESRSRGLFKLAMYKLGENIDRNDTKSIIDYLKYKEEQDNKRQVKTRSLNLSPEEQKEADDFARSTGERNRGVALKAEKAMVQANVFKSVSEDIEQ